MLRIAVSSRALFHMEDGNEIFQTKGQQAFNDYMREKENIPLRKGIAFGLVRKLLSLNSIKGVGREKVDIVMLSRNSVDAGMRVLNSIQHYDLDIERAVFCQGSDRFKYVKAFQAQLFLSANHADVKTAINHGMAAATMLPSESTDSDLDSTIRIAFDGDSVLFSNEADEMYRQKGLEAFRNSEIENVNVPLGAGPFKSFLESLNTLQKSFPADHSPLQVALVTARGLPSHGRALNSLRHLGIRVDEAIFAGGLPKGPLLQAYGADMFFDDTQKNIDSANSYGISSGHVPYGAGQGIVSNTV